ncbi:olfactory receptor 11H6-like [Ambystoma mexicanum]|uniref:olfactory receptor 11H6-like n=1 Tax=Ambystoma mexicanum TaxID=8296 RepID=UPI0037E8CBBC
MALRLTAENPDPPIASTVVTGTTNGSHTVTHFIFQGFSSHRGVQGALFLLFLIDYLLTLTGNIAIVFVIRTDYRLHKPMYYLMSQLSFLEIWYTTSTMPNLLVGLLQDVKSISFPGCFTQFYFMFSLGAVECFLLTMMGYDRFLAICKPLHYHKLMTSQVCLFLTLSCWAVGLLWFLVPIVLISQLPFCGPNLINHFLCDRGPLMDLSCQQDYITEVTLFTFATILGLGTFLVIVVSYVCIMSTIVMMTSADGRHKAFSTCASHLIVVSIFYGSVLFMYMRPIGKHSFSLDKVVALIYTVLTPLLNPVIYALRNKEVKQALKEILKSWRDCCISMLMLSCLTLTAMTPSPLLALVLEAMSSLTRKAPKYARK